MCVLLLHAAYQKSERIKQASKQTQPQQYNKKNQFVVVDSVLPIPQVGLPNVQELMNWISNHMKKNNHKIIRRFKREKKTEQQVFARTN